MFRTRTQLRRLAALGLCLAVATGCQSDGHDHDHDHDHAHEHGDHDHDHGDHDHAHGDDHDHDHSDDGDTAMAPATGSSFYALNTKSLDGDDMTLDQFEGKVTLVVNVASECGLTPQYEGLQALHEELAAEGFTVLAFPSNDFGGQEPGTPEQIQSFCSTNYGVTFPMAQKVQTKDGDAQSPIYAHLEQATGELPSWNFGKYLVSRDGTSIRYFAPQTAPDDSVLRAAIQAELGKAEG